MFLLAQMQTTEWELSLMMLATFLSLVFRIIGGVTGPIIMLVAAKKLMRIPSRWPAYVFSLTAVYSILSQALYVTIHPIVQNLGYGLRIETYVKISQVLVPIGLLLSLATSIAVLTVCKRLARSFNESNGA